MTSIKGTFSYCGYGEPAAIELTCTGTHCDALVDFPDTTCSTSGITTTCTNDVQCEKALWITDLGFDLADAEKALVQQKHKTTIPECDYQFEVTSDGKPAGVVMRDITSPNAECNNLVLTGTPLNTTIPSGTPSNATIPSGARNSTIPLSTRTTPPLTVSTAGAPRNFKAPYLLAFLVVFGLFMPALAHDLVARSHIVPAKPDESLFPKNAKTDICAKLGNLVLPRSLEARVPEYGELSVMKKRDIESFFQNDFVKKGLAYVTGKLRNYVHDSDKPVFADCLRAEVSSYLCKQVAKDLLVKVTGITVIKELVPACVAVINELAVFDMEPFTKVGLFLFSSVFCNWFVADAIPVIPCFQDAVCKKFEDLFPETKCEASPPGTPPPPVPVGTVITYKTRSSTEYQSGGSLSTNPNKCGAFFNQCDSQKCENGACTKASCVGKTCETFQPCGPGGDCVCGTIRDSSSGFCVYGRTPCAGLTDCTASSQCGSGEVCIESSCCQRSVCVGPDQCGGGSSRKRWLAGSGPNVYADTLLRRGWVNATIATQGEWVD